MEGGGAYGAGKATGQFDPLTIIKKPQVIIRLVSWVFSIIVFGCISSKGSFSGVCLYNGDKNACGFGMAIGIIAFLGLMGFLVADVLFDNIPSVQQRKYIVIGDMAFSALWTFMWFVCFCYLTDAWRKSGPLNINTQNHKSAVEAAIAFAFFSIGTFGGLAGLAVMRYRSGISEDFSGGYDPDVMGGGGGGVGGAGGVGGGIGGGVPQPTPSPYSNYPSAGETGDPYQQGPFTGQPEPVKQPPAEFSPPTY